MRQTRATVSIFAGCLLACAVWSPRPVAASPTPTTEAAAASRHIDLAGAHRLARAKNPDLETLAERVRQADLLINRAWTVLLPNVTATAAITRNSDEVSFDLPAGAGPPVTLTIQESWNKRFGITASADLLNASAVPLIKNAYDNREATRLDSAHRRAGLLLSVSSAYYQVHAAGQLARMAREDLATARRFEQDAAALRKVGSATSLDTHRARLRMLAARKALDDAEDGVKLARAALARLLGLRGDAFTLAAPPAVEGPAEDLNALTRRALRDRDDLRSLRLSREMARRSKLATWLGWAPVLGVTYNWRYDTAGGFTGKNDTWQLIFGARWSLLEGGRRITALSQGASKERVAQNAVRARALAVRHEIRRQQLQLRKAERNLALSARQAELARQAYEMVTRRYRAGMASSLEVVDAGADLASRRIAQVVERLRRDLARLRLRRAVGA